MADVPVSAQRSFSALMLACCLSASLALPSPARAGATDGPQAGPAITPSIRIVGTTFERKEETRATATYVAEYLPASTLITLRTAGGDGVHYVIESAPE